MKALHDRTIPLPKELTERSAALALLGCASALALFLGDWAAVALLWSQPALAWGWKLALALPLLVATSLGVMATWRFINGPQGFEPAGGLTLRLIPPYPRYPSADARLRGADAIL